MRFGVPSKTLHDQQGGDFENSLFENLANLLEIQNLQTTPHPPQTNGFAERKNQTILCYAPYLRSISHPGNHLFIVIYIYYCTTHSNKGYSAYHLLFGRRPRLPIDLILQTRKDSPSRCNHSEYLERLKKDMEDAFEVPLTKSTGRKEKDVQRKLKSGPCLGVLEPGDKLFVRYFVTKWGSRKTKVVLGTWCCRRNTKTWKRYDLHHQNNLPTRKSSDITQTCLSLSTIHYKQGMTCQIFPSSTVDLTLNLELNIILTNFASKDAKFYVD